MAKDTDKGEEEFGGIKFVIDSGEGEKEAGADLLGQLFGIPREPAGGKQKERQEGKEEKSEIQKKIEQLLELVANIDQMEDGAEKREAEEVVRGIIKSVYSEYTKEYRPAINLVLPVVGELLGKDLNLLLLPLLRLSNEVGQSEEVKEERQRGRKIKATTRKAIYNAYIDVGFTPDQAMALLMNDIARSSSANIVQEVASVATSMPSGVKKAAKEGTKRGIEKVSKRKQS